jgi:hypothetical protein
MMLNATQNERTKEAQKQHRLKLTLELALYGSLLPIFRGFSTDLRKHYAKHGNMIHTHDFRADVKKKLEKHYNKVSEKFAKTIVNKIGKPDNHDQIIVSILTKTDIHNQLRAAESAKIIANTTHQDMIESIIQAINEVKTKGEQITSKNVANIAEIRLKKKMHGRLTTIATTETNNPAEHTKQTEIDYLNHHDAIIKNEKIREKTKKKQWLAILDKVTRETHAESDMQIVDFNDAYIVDGEKLMYPGDMSLGASIGNTINCRCSSIIIID